MQPNMQVSFQCSFQTIIQHRKGLEKYLEPFHCFRYMISEWIGGSLLRVEPTRRQEDQAEFQCVAENGVGDPVSAKAYIRVYDSKLTTMNFPFE